VVQAPHPPGLPPHQGNGTGWGKQQQTLPGALTWTLLAAYAAPHWSAARQHPAEGLSR
jgi:hypothetical protein